MEHEELVLEPLPFGKRSIFDILAETFDDLPAEIVEQLPTDGAENHDHYLYGWPKKEATGEDK